MAKYIHKQAAIHALVNEANMHNNPIKRAYTRAAAIIEQITAEDVQPMKRGHWYHNTSKYVSELDAYFIQACCSCCGRYSDRIDQYSQIMSNETCSHCGADMRGDA